MKTDVTVAEEVERVVKEAVRVGGRLDMYGALHTRPLTKVAVLG